MNKTKRRVPAYTRALDYDKLAGAVGISVRHVYRVLNQGHMPSLRVLRAMSTAMDLSMDELSKRINRAAYNAKGRRTKLATNWCTN